MPDVTETVDMLITDVPCTVSVSVEEARRLAGLGNAIPVDTRAEECLETT